MELAALIISGIAILVSGVTWYKSHQFETKRLAKEEEWRQADISREFRAHEPQIEIEQFLKASGPPEVPEESLYFVVIAKNIGRIPVTLASKAHVALADPDVIIDPTDLSRPSSYISGRDDSSWYSPNSFPVWLEPNEAIHTYIDLGHITQHASQMNAVVEPEEKYKACVGFYHDTLGRFYKPTYALQFDKS